MLKRLLQFLFCHFLTAWSVFVYNFGFCFAVVFSFLRCILLAQQNNLSSIVLSLSLYVCSLHISQSYHGFVFVLFLAHLWNVNSFHTIYHFIVPTIMNFLLLLAFFYFISPHISFLLPHPIPCDALTTVV